RGPGEMIGWPLAQLVHPEDRARLRERLQLRMEGEDLAPRTEYRILTKSGAVRWMDVSSRMIAGDDGPFLVATALDLTDRRRMEEDLRHSEERFRTLAETVNALVVVTQGDHVVYANRAAYDYIGVTPGEAANMSFWEPIHPDHRSIVQQRAAARERGEDVPSRYEIKVVLRGGEERWLDLSLARFEHDGRPAVLSTAFDITARKRADELLRKAHDELEVRVKRRTAELEEINLHLRREIEDRRRAEDQLRKSEETARVFLNATHELALLVDPEGRIIMANEAAARRWGRPADDLVGTVAYDLFPFEKAQERRRLMQQVLRDRRPYHDEDRVGDEIFSASHYPIMDERGRVERLAIFVQNVTEQRRAEEELQRRREKAAHVQRLSTMGEMASGLAHELNQPLCAIVNYAGGCVERMRKPAPNHAEIVEALQEITRLATGASDIVRYLRDFAHKRPPKRSAVGLNESVHRAVRLLEPMIDRSKVEFHYDLSPDLPPISADPTQLEQVLLNLIRNSIEGVTAAGGGKVVLRTETVSEGEVEVCVSDSGGGIAPEDAAHVFDPFFTTKSDGLGMGLAISRTIVESYGGRLWLEPGFDRRVEFRFRLPLYERDLDENGVD
ncbi:MAG: PAS domain S-box protein, partial [Candidatus Eisenbacteria bacterium]|nr:PAS domain S-box protein [Candidatus Eisenbacteria bacterium]